MASMSDVVNEEITNLQPIFEYTLTIAMAYTIVAEQLQSNTTDTMIVLVNIVLFLILTIIFRSYIQTTVTRLAIAAHRDNDTTTLSDVIIVPLQLFNYILKQVVQPQPARSLM